MKVKTMWLITILSFLLISAAASANSVNNIPITGTAGQGFDITYGDFQLQGPNLTLGQGQVDGPNSIGSCTLGAMCDFTFQIEDVTAGCRLCTGFAGGSFGNTTVQFLDTDITFSGSALYSGQTDVIVPLTFTGIIVGYKLVNCTGDVDCSLGPKEFTVYISGQGTGDFSFYGAPGNINGVGANFTGTASVVSTAPEPISLLLTATGLVGVGIAKRRAGNSPDLRS